MIGLIDSLILDSLNVAPKTLKSIHEDTLLSFSLLFPCLQDLLVRGFLKYDLGQYFINPSKIQELNAILKDEESKQVEWDSAQEYFQPVELKRYEIGADDLKVLEGLLERAKIFLNSCGKKNKHKSQTKLKTYVFWGWSPVKNLVYGLNQDFEDSQIPLSNLYSKQFPEGIA